MNPLARIAAGQEVPLPPRTAPLDEVARARLLGTWRAASGEALEVLAHGGGYALASEDPGVLRLLGSGARGTPDGELVLHDLVTGETTSLAPAADGGVRLAGPRGELVLLRDA